MFRIAIAQINPTVGDILENEKKVREIIEKVKLDKVQLILFPELVLTGYPPEDLLYNKNFIATAKESLERLRAVTVGISAVVGLPIMENGSLYNSAAVLSDGELRQIVNKSELPNYGVFDEKRYFTPAETNEPVMISGVNIAVTICEDIWVDNELISEVCGRPDVELILNLSSSPFHIGKTEERRKIIREWAKKQNKHVAYCNLVGGQDELVFDGGSIVCNGEGEIVASAKEFEEDLLVVDIPVDDGKSDSNAVINQPLSYPENIYRALTLGVKDYFEKNGFNKAIIAVSGGIDSALTVAIAVGALGKDRVSGVAMPSYFSSESSLLDARELAQNYGIELDLIPITPLMEAFDSALEEKFRDTEQGVAEENIQARIRGALVMAISNKFGSLVLTTGNKSELSVGYCTLYGDMAGGFAVIKDLPKIMVYEVCEWVNANPDLAQIPQSTITKEPSAELRPDQKDSDSLPDYSLLDAILKHYLEDEESIEEIVKRGYQEDEVVKVLRLVNSSEYKRRQGAPGVKITPKAFGKDRRYPVTNRFM